MKADKFTHYTPGAMELTRAHDDDTREPIDGLEEYTYGNITLALTEDERAEFEQDAGITLEDDVLNSIQFEQLLAKVPFEDGEKISVAMAHCVAAFEDFDELPDELDTLCRDGRLSCTSYQNDNCPSFMIAGTEGNEDAQMLFVEYLDTAKRGRAYWKRGEPIPKRFTVITCCTDKALYHGDDLKAALFQLMLKMNTERVALVFVTDLMRRVGAKKMATIAQRNRTQKNPDICHTHDFVDANVFMDDAIKAVYGQSATDTGGEGIGVMSDDMHHVWDLAWSRAKVMIDARFPLTK